MKPILVSMGEPAGIGPDICLELARLGSDLPIIVLGDEDVLYQRAKLLNKSIRDLNILHVSGLTEAVHPGVLNSKHAPFVIQLLEKACDLCLNGEYQALVTAPVHKGILNQAGFDFSGHTEFLAARCDIKTVVMMLATSRLRVALLTTHIPLDAVSAQVTPFNLTQVTRILHHSLIHQFGIAKPRIAVAGLNPHAGEGGYLGREEIDIMIPALKELQQEGLNVSLPMPADTLFTPEGMQSYDAALCMYHDQGLPVLKSQGFGEAVNITLGLPIVRTSVDHGTALDKAGTGHASATSLIAAIHQASEMKI